MRLSGPDAWRRGNLKMVNMLRRALRSLERSGNGFYSSQVGDPISGLGASKAQLRCLTKELFQVRRRSVRDAETLETTGIFMQSHLLRSY